MKKGDKVTKKSGKPFQNGMKSAIIESFTKMEIPLGNRHPGKQIVSAVNLVGCNGSVRISQLK